MRKNAFWIILTLLTGIVLVVAVMRKPANAPRLGEEHPDQGTEHLTQIDQPHEPYNSDLPSSGPHYVQPAEWGAYEQAIPPEVFIHNLEHGGIVVAYRPDLPQDQIDKLKTLLTEPFSRQGFRPTKVLLMPRAENKHPIQLASWRRTLNLDTYDEDTLVQFYLTNVGKSPEPTAP
jgi:hypothetical protein